MRIAGGEAAKRGPRAVGRAIVDVDDLVRSAELFEDRREARVERVEVILLVQ
jgi:hypothetical protein